MRQERLIGLGVARFGDLRESLLPGAGGPAEHSDGFRRPEMGETKVLLYAGSCWE
jgi:hypothetical protein